MARRGLSMYSTKRTIGNFTLRFCGSVVLASVLAISASNNSAFAQEASMRSTLDPQSPLAESPLDLKAKKKKKRRATPLAANNPDKYKTDTISDADQESEAMLRLYGDDEAKDDGETEDGAKPDSKLKRTATALSELKPEADENTDDKDASSKAKLDSKSKKTKDKKTTKTSKKNGKTALDPGLDEQSTGSLTVRKGQKAQMLRAQPAIAAEAVQSRDLTEEKNPFKAVGIRVGSIVLRPSIEQGLEVTTNSTASAGGGAATSSVTTFRLDRESEWRKGSFEASGFLTLRKSLSTPDEIDPESGGTFKFTQPILREWNYSIGGAYGLKRESAVSGSAFPVTITKRPLAQNLRLSLDVGKGEGVLQPEFKLELDRMSYGDAIDSTGLAISQADRDQTTLRGTFRLGAEISSAFTPYVEVAYGETWRDENIDVFGNDRSANDLRVSVGAEINVSEKLNGELSVGWLRQTFDASTLSDIEGLALAAALNWSPFEGTIVSAGLTTAAEPANSATVSGSMVYAATLGITHQLSDRLSTSANFGASYRDFTDLGGTDTTLSAELAATYWVNRMLGINAKARHESVTSSDPLRESDTTTLLLGLKLQR